MCRKSVADDLLYFTFVLGAVEVQVGIHFWVDHFGENDVEFVA